MAISDTIQSMYENVGNVYDVLELAGADLTNVDKNIQNLKQTWEERLLYFLANGLDVVWNNWNKVSGSGTTITLNNTIQAKMDFVYKGNTSQESTNNQIYLTSVGPSGTTYNIKEPTLVNGVINVQGKNDPNYNSNNYRNGYVNIYNIVWKPNTTYYVSCKIDIVSNPRNVTTFNALCYGEGPASITLRYNSQTQRYEGSRTVESTIPENRNYLEIRAASCELNISEISVKETADYTFDGYGPSPTPEYPSPVNVVTGDNEVKVEGKNLFSGIETLQSATYVDGVLTIANASSSISNAINVLGSTSYTLSLNSSQSSTRIYIREYNENNEQIKYSTSYSRPYVLTTTENTKKITIVFSPSTSETFPVTISNIQLERGSASSYIPYKAPTTYPINLGSMELCKIGDYQDVIKRSSGKNLAKPTFDTKLSVAGSGDTRTCQTSTNNCAEIIEVQSNTEYTISGDFSILKNGTMRIAMFDNLPTNASTSTKVVTSATTFTITTDTNTKYLLLWNGNDIDTTISNLQVEKGNISTPVYEPYGKVWCKYETIGKVVLTGASNEGWGTVWGNAPNVYKTYSIIPSLYRNSSQSEIICKCNNYPATYYDGGNQSMWKLKDDDNYPYLTCIGDTETRKGNVFIKNVDMATAEDLKTWLSTHNTTVYYVLATPTYTKITDELLTYQLEQIKYSYSSQTNINQTNTDKPFILDVIALKDLDAEDTTPALTINRGLSFTQPPVSENSINDENDNSMLEETINEEEPNIEDNNREEEEPVDFFEEEIINNNEEEQEEISIEPIEIDNGQR